MTKEEWTKTDVYKQAQFYNALSKLLSDPNTKMSEFITLGSKYGLKADVVFKVIEDPNISTVNQGGP